VESFDLSMAVRAGLLAAVCLLAALAQPASGSGHAPRTDAPVTAQYSTSSLQSVSCASAGNCAAVGGYADSSGGEGLLLSEQHGVWGDGVEALLPADAAWGPAASRKPWRQVFLSSVSCSSVGECVAVGEYQTRSGFERGLILTETGGVWQTGIVAPVPANTGGESTLRSVSCPSVGNCAAVGTYRLTSDHHSSLEGLLVTQHGETWFGYKAVLPADAHSSSNAGRPYAWTPQKVALESVSCPSAGNCSAVGEYKDANSQRGESHSQGLLLSESGGVWEPGGGAVLPANAYSNPIVRLHSVSCSSANVCAAVGEYLTYDSDGGMATDPGLLLTESGGTWQAGVEQTGIGPPSSAPFSENLPSISCTSAGECVAAGSVLVGNAIRSVLAVQSGGQWQPGLEGPVPADTSDFVGMLAVSCASAGNCAAVGGYHRNGADWAHALLLSENGGSWHAVVPSLPADTASYLSWVSCPSAGNCVAVGRYSADVLQPQGVLLSETEGIWGTGVAVMLPPSVDTRITALEVKARTARISVLGVGRFLPLSFECRLDGRPFATCAPTQAASRGAAAFPVRYAHLTRGKHRFEVKAVDGQGAADSTPAIARFRVR
jgi:hypothetical protein